MRFCPFCAQENPDEERECVHCGKRLPAMRTAPARPAAAPAAKPAPRAAPPRPAPRPRSIEAPVPPPPNKPGNNVPTVPAALAGKASPADATLKPLASVKPKDGPNDRPMMPAPSEDTHEVTNPRARPVAAPTGTLLGMTAQEIADSMRPPSAEKDSGRRTTQPLGLSSLAGEAKPLDFDDRPTEIGAPAMPVDDGPTRPQGRVDIDDDAPTTARELPKKRPGERLSTTPPVGVPVVPPRPAPRSQPLTPPVAPVALAPPSSLAETKPTPLPETLPAPPKVTNDAGSFPQLDMQPTPAIPTLALPPMPEGPKSSSPIEAVKYLVPLAKAVWARKKAQDQIRTLLHGDQRLLDEVLKELGRVAREEQLPVPALADEMRLMKEHESRREAAEKAMAEAEASKLKEEERWRIDKGERLADRARREAELNATDEELRQKAEERRKHDAERAKLDTQIRAAEKKAAAADARAAKADVTPPEKGGGPNTAANARAEAEEARKEATALIEPRDAARARTDALDGPIATLTDQLTEQRSSLAQKRKDLTEATAAHEATLKQLEDDRAKAAAEADAAERELTQRFVTAGTILNLNRVEHPKLQPLFGRVDELKNGVNAREAAIVRLESERRLYDRAALQKGLITVGIAVAVVVLLAIILIVILAR